MELLGSVPPDCEAVIDTDPNALAATEVILALSATVDGQTTAHYIAEKLATTKVEVTRLAHGVPVGGELDYLDDGTLAQALRARAKLVS